MSDAKPTHKARDVVGGEILDEISRKIASGEYGHAKNLAITYRLIAGGAQPGSSIVESK